MSIMHVINLMLSDKIPDDQVVTVTTGDIRSVVKIMLQTTDVVNKLNGIESTIKNVVEPPKEYIYMDGSKYKSRAFNDRYMTVENILAALNTFSENEIPAADVAERVVTHIVPAEQLRKRTRDVNFSKIAKGRINSVINEIVGNRVSSELAKFLESRMIQKHGRWVIKK